MTKTTCGSSAVKTPPGRWLPACAEHQSPAPLRRREQHPRHGESKRTSRADSGRASLAARTNYLNASYPAADTLRKAAATPRPLRRRPTLHYATTACGNSAPGPKPQTTPPCATALHSSLAFRGYEATSWLLRTFKPECCRLTITPGPAHATTSTTPPGPTTAALTTMTPSAQLQLSGTAAWPCGQSAWDSGWCSTPKDPTTVTQGTLKTLGSTCTTSSPVSCPTSYTFGIASQTQASSHRSCRRYEDIHDAEFPWVFFPPPTAPQ